MTNDIREKAEAFLDYIENKFDYKDNLEYTREYKDLKAALRPSREEIAKNLDYLMSGGALTPKGRVELGEYVKLAIEELRK